MTDPTQPIPFPQERAARSSSTRDMLREFVASGVHDPVVIRGYMEARYPDITYGEIARLVEGLKADAGRCAAKTKQDAAGLEYLMAVVAPAMKDNPEMTLNAALKVLAGQGDPKAKTFRNFLLEKTRDSRQ